MTKLQLNLKSLGKKNQQQFYAECHRVLKDQISKRAAQFFKDEDERRDQVANFFLHLMTWPPDVLLKHNNPVALILLASKNFFKNQIRLKKNQSTLPIEESMSIEAPQLGIEQKLIIEEQLESVFRQIDLLSCGQKIALKLKIAGYSHKEIGELLEISETASESRVNRARKNILTTFRHFKE